MLQNYSKELKILDKNTVQIMIDEMQEELVQKEQQIELLSQQNVNLKNYLPEIYIKINISLGK